MDRRELFGAFGAAAAGMMAAGAFGAAVGEGEGDHHHHMDRTHEDCLKACGECAKACNMMVHHCLDKLADGEGPAKVHARAAALAADCQHFCVLSATLIARRSDLMLYSCESCAEACRCCAEACEKADDAAMKECGEKCRACEKTCREMVRHMKATAAKG